jgi:hypothetical protein
MQLRQRGNSLGQIWLLGGIFGQQTSSIILLVSTCQAEMFYSAITRVIGQARLWVRAAIEEAGTPFAEAHAAGNAPANYEYVMGVLETYLNERIPTMHTPPDTSMPGPQDPSTSPGASKAIDAVRRDVVVLTG